MGVPLLDGKFSYPLAEVPPTAVVVQHEQGETQHLHGEGPLIQQDGPGQLREGPQLLGEGLGQHGEVPQLRGEGPQLRGEGPQLIGEGPGQHVEDPQLQGGGTGQHGEGPQLRGEGPQLRGEALRQRGVGEALQLHGESESLYIKCLFKTISYFDLRDHLVQRKVDISGDSFYIMTLKLRLNILERNNCNENVQMDLRTELAQVTKKTDKGYYNCSLAGCHYSSKNYRSLLDHLKLLHSQSSQPIVCQYNGCSRVLSSVKMLSLHLRTSHQTRKSSVVLKQNQLAEEMCELQCMSVSCGHQKFKTVKELKIHLRSAHTDKRQEINCIFDGCSFSTNVSGTFKSHISKKHPLQLKHNLKREILTSSDADTQMVEENRQYDVDTTAEVCNDVSIDDLSESNLGVEGYMDDLEREDDGQVLFTRALAMQFNSWCNIKNIAYTTVSQIVTEVFNSYQLGVDVTKSNVRKILENEGFTADKIGEVFEEVDIKDPFQNARKELEKESDRLKYISTQFENVKPVSVRLNTGDLREKAETMQYVPLKQSLKILLEDESFISQKISDPYFPEENVIKDCIDGAVFGQNKFFSDNPSAVKLVVFQDELEVANPLGAGKNLHKIQCTYFTILDVIPALRTKVKSVQLCSLVLSRHWKKYGNGPCNKNLIDDLKDLETDGLQIMKPVKKIIKAGLALIVGDNLGQHMLSELNCSFSSGYICRVCDSTYNDACKKRLIYSGIEPDYKTNYITKEKYDACANLAMENGPSSESLGIKNHCVFNVLASFHCIDQCAPCLGHDYFEGCFAYDVQQYLDFMISKEKLLLVDEFNAKIRGVKLSSRDAKNRPKPFKKGAKKYGGNAGSLRVLSRVLTLILSPVLEFSRTEKYLIKLHEVGEIITAPTLTLYEIDVTMSQIIMDYLDLRVEAVEILSMPNPRPKHHYLSHYPRSYRNTGPLINTWAMRMEQKHTYFKGVIRTAKNFINVPLTCATRHQFAQISYCYQGLFPRSKIEIPDIAPEISAILTVTQDPELKQFLSSSNPYDLVPKYVKIFGTKYEPGNILVLEKICHGLLKIGLIKSLVSDGKIVTFCVTSFEASQSKFGFYVTTKFLSNFETVKFEELADYYPLEMTGTHKSFSFFLHHFVADKSLAQL